MARSQVVGAALEKQYGLRLERRHGRWVTVGNHPGNPFGERRWNNLRRIQDVMELKTSNSKNRCVCPEEKP